MRSSPLDGTIWDERLAGCRCAPSPQLAGLTLSERTQPTRAVPSYPLTLRFSLLPGFPSRTLKAKPEPGGLADREAFSLQASARPLRGTPASPFFLIQARREWSHSMDSIEGNTLWVLPSMPSGFIYLSCPTLQNVVPRDAEGASRHVGTSVSPLLSTPTQKAGLNALLSTLTQFRDFLRSATGYWLIGFRRSSPPLPFVPPLHSLASASQTDPA
jgi:hypothetical protein